MGGHHVVYTSMPHLVSYWTARFEVSRIRTSGQSNLTRPHRHRRRTVHSYSLGCTNVPFCDGALAPPSEYDWTCASTASLCPPESITQTASRSVQPFCRVSLYFTTGRPFPLKITTSHLTLGMLLLYLWKLKIHIFCRCGRKCKQITF